MYHFSQTGVGVTLAVDIRDQEGIARRLPVIGRRAVYLICDKATRPARRGQRALDGFRSLPRGQFLDRAKLGLQSGWLSGQVAVKGLEARVGEVERRDLVAGISQDGSGNMVGLG